MGAHADDRGCIVPRITAGFRCSFLRFGHVLRMRLQVGHGGRQRQHRCQEDRPAARAFAVLAQMPGRVGFHATSLSATGLRHGSGFAPDRQGCGPWGAEQQPGSGGSCGDDTLAALPFPEPSAYTPGGGRNKWAWQGTQHSLSDVDARTAAWIAAANGPMACVALHPAWRAEQLSGTRRASADETSFKFRLEIETLVPVTLCHAAVYLWVGRAKRLLQSLGSAVRARRQ